MGSKISTVEIESENKELMAGKKRTKTQSSSSSNYHISDIIFNCCKSPIGSPNTTSADQTPEVNKKAIKRSRRSLYNNLHSSTTLSTGLQLPQSVKASTNVMLCRRTAEKGSFLAAFFKIFDDDVIQDFLWMDSCFILADKYLLAIIYTYFRRANMNRREYNRTNFFAALYLAHDMEEDNEDLKLEIYPWALGDQWRSQYFDFISHRDVLLQRMSYRAVVSKQTTDEVISLCPMHPIWKRDRKAHHGGAERVYPEDEDSEFFPRGPNSSPLSCVLCFPIDPTNYCSSAFTSGYLSACSSSEFILSPIDKQPLKQKDRVNGEKEFTKLYGGLNVVAPHFECEE